LRIRTCAGAKLAVDTRACIRRMSLAAGFMGKLYAEAIEAIDLQQVMAVSATGASRPQTFVYGVIPQALPLVASYSCCSRPISDRPPCWALSARVESGSSSGSTWLFSSINT
jgi:hypothetical protein